VNKVTEASYGVYFMTEQIGRGTDFPSSNEIETNGGIVLLMASVFNSTMTEQIRGRIRRLQYKGQV
jgi:hypothetical protein